MIWFRTSPAVSLYSVAPEKVSKEFQVVLPALPRLDSAWSRPAKIFETFLAEAESEITDGAEGLGAIETQQNRKTLWKAPSNF
jgi:hypothetical protein